jgi:hypothetical protein
MAFLRRGPHGAVWSRAPRASSAASCSLSCSVAQRQVCNLQQGDPQISALRFLYCTYRHAIYFGLKLSNTFSGDFRLQAEGGMVVCLVRGRSDVEARERLMSVYRGPDKELMATMERLAARLDVHAGMNSVPYRFPQCGSWPLRYAWDRGRPRS